MGGKAHAIDALPGVTPTLPSPVEGEGGTPCQHPTHYLTDVLGYVETHHSGGIRHNGFIDAVIGQNFKAAVDHFHFASSVR